MKRDGIDGIIKIPPDPSRAEWVDKTYKTDCDEKILFLAAAVRYQRWFLIWDVVGAILTHEDISQDLLLHVQIMQLVCSFWTSCLDEVRAKPQGIACLT